MTEETRLMDEERLLHRYQLALALIGDRDAAGDLFQAARDDDHLRRLAARWRRDHDLAPAPDFEVLPTLTDEQKEHALHLARRGASLRRVRGWLAAAATAVILLAGGYLAYAATRPNLDSHPAFAQPGLITASAQGLTLAVHQVDQTDTGYAVYWSITGFGAADGARTFEPLLVWQESRVRKVVTGETRHYTTRPDRLLGMTQFQAPPLRATARFRINSGRIQEGELMVVLPPPTR